MRGKINVTEKVPMAANVTVRVGGQEAQHNAGSGNHLLWKLEFEISVNRNYKGISTDKIHLFFVMIMHACFDFCSWFDTGVRTASR